MAIETINKYISEAYSRLLDYATFHAEKQRLYGLGDDLLNHVLVGILERIDRQEPYQERVIEMLNSKKGKWTELDFHVLSIIKFNAESDTAPFKRHYDLYKPAGTYTDVDFSLLDIADDREENLENEKKLQEREQRFKDACDIYGLSPKAMDIFRWKFIEGNHLSDYPHNKDRKDLYATYNGVLKLVKDKLNGNSLF